MCIIWTLDSEISSSWTHSTVIKHIYDTHVHDTLAHDTLAHDTHAHDTHALWLEAHS